MFKKFGVFGYFIGVDYKEYSKIKPNISKIKVFIKPGFLGIKWVQDYVIYYDGKLKPLYYDYLFIGYKYYKNGYLDKALEIYTEGIKRTKGNYLLFYNRGIAFRKKFLYHKALLDFKKAIELKPDYIEAYQNVDWILSKQRNWDKIIKLWSEFINKFPENPEGYFRKAFAYYKIYYKIGNKELALKNLKKACSLGKKEACTLYKRISESS